MSKCTAAGISAYPQKVGTPSGSAICVPILINSSAKTRVAVTLQDLLASHARVEQLQRILLRPADHGIEPANMHILRALCKPLECYDKHSYVHTGEQGESQAHKQTQEQ